jgi:hypothetical protein
MPSIHIVNVDVDLLRAIAIEAANKGVGRRDLVVSVLCEHFFPGADQSNVGRHAAPTPQVVRRRVKKIEAEKSAASTHDPATCRVYKCGLCAVAKSS